MAVRPIHLDRLAPSLRQVHVAEMLVCERELNVRIAIPCHYDMFPDNSLPPRLLRTNLMVEGIGERYRELEHGRAYTFPEPSAVEGPRAPEGIAGS